MSVQDVKVERRGSVFFIRLPDRSKAYLAVKEENKTMYLVETYTPERYRGRGYARRLVEAAIKYAEDRGLKVIPICSYAIYYFMKHPDKRHVLDNKYRSLSDDEWEKLFKKRLEEERGK